MREPLDVDCDTFAWRESGTGELVVLLHGLGGSRISWEPQLATLGRSRRVVAWDLPGYGAAAPLPDQPLTFRALADAAADLIRALGAERAHVVGISMGGMIGQYLAAWSPHRVRSLTLLSSSPAFGLDGTRPDEWRAARLAPLDQGLEPADFADRVLGAISGPQISSAAMAGQKAAMARVTGAALRRSIDCLVTHDSRPLLPAIQAATLVMVGERDGETPVQYSQYLVDHLPHAQLVVVPGAGHLLNVESPDVVNEHIERHLAAVEAA
ncbi:MAG: alpha/beta hydrolase [Actinobacteria bacterium]|nr:alpha/beta hydrolase [Actinomycetota bacterium]